MTRRWTFPLVLGLVAAASARCGGGAGAPASPSPAPDVPTANACGAIGAASAGATAIVNGAPCATGNSAVVLVNVENEFGLRLGACSGTVIAPRAVLTGAHCLDEDVGRAKIWLGSGPEIAAQSFAYHPGYREDGSPSPDVGIVRMEQDLSPAPIPLLTSRDARVGETAVIAGWGRDQSSVPATLRAGTALVTAANARYLETQFSANGSSICAGDSGGPILLSQGGVWAVAGVISAASTSACTTGTNYYVNIRNPDALAFVLQHVPDARQR